MREGDGAGVEAGLRGGAGAGGDCGGSEEARRGEGGRLAGLREEVSAGWRGEGAAAAAAAAEAVVEGVGAGFCEGASRWVEGLMAWCACDRMRLAALLIRKSRRAQGLPVCVRT